MTLFFFELLSSRHVIFCVGDNTLPDHKEKLKDAGKADNHEKNDPGFNKNLLNGKTLIDKTKVEEESYVGHGYNYEIQQR